MGMYYGESYRLLHEIDFKSDVENESIESGVLAVLIVFSILVVLTILFLWMGLKRVNHAEVMIIERFGKYKSTLRPGYHFIWPIIEHARKINWKFVDGNQVVSILTDRIDLREHVINFEPQHVITKDTVMVQIDAMVYFRITDPRLAVFKIQLVPDAIAFLTQATLRNVVAGMSLEDIFSSREVINSELLMLVRPDVERWGISITRVEIFNIIPPADIKRAMEMQIRAERERRSEVLEADGQRESMIIKSRGDAAKIVLEAEGLRTSTHLKAKGEAESKILESRSEAQAIQAIRLALTEKNVHAVDYLTSVQYLNALQKLTKDSRRSKVVLLPSENIKNLDEVVRLNFFKK